MESFLHSGSALAICVAAFGCPSAIAQTIELISQNSAGAQGNFDSTATCVSGDGRFVAFVSAASNLVAGDTNASYDVFVRDRATGTTERVSVSTTGGEAIYDCSLPCISADGRCVAFSGAAPNLVGGDTNGVSDVFLRDRVNGTTERVSVGAAGVQANSYSYSSSISADGRFVAFETDATNLAAGDTNGAYDVFVRDRVLATTELVSQSSAGAHGNAASSAPSISADGRFVAFISGASNLVAGDTNGYYDVFVRDRVNGTTERVSITTGGFEGDAGDFFNAPSISAGGRFVAFTSPATNLVVGDTNEVTDVFVRDRTAGTTERVSVSTSGGEGADSSRPSISADGRFVAFVSLARNFCPVDTNGRLDVFVHDRASGATERESESAVGAQANSMSLAPSISADGRFVSFGSYATNLIAGDTNGRADVFLRDRGPVPPATYCTAGTSSHGCVASIGASAQPSVSSGHACSVSVVDLEGQKNGLLFYGIDNLGFMPTPWASGSSSFLCVKTPVQRTPIESSGGTVNACDGSFALDWNAYQAANPFALGNPWSAGDEIYLQAWFRDPAATSSTNLSNALEMTYVP